MGVVSNTAIAAVSFWLAVALLVAKRPAIRGTTLLQPWLWLLIALTALAVVESSVSVYPGNVASNESEWAGWIRASRFVTAIGLLLPMVSLLGAKRPQDRAWHLIVLSLWVVLALPAAEAYLLRGGSTIQIHDARGWFLWILLLTGVVNYMPTRYWMASLLFAVGQIGLLADFLPLVRSRLPWNQYQPGWAICILLAVLIVCFRKVPASNGPFDNVWCRFCDAYGFLWGMRVAERTNAVPGRSESRLDWRRIINIRDDSKKSSSSQDRHEDVERTLRAHLMRFVSEDWFV